MLKKSCRQARQRVETVFGTRRQRWVIVGSDCSANTPSHHRPVKAQAHYKFLQRTAMLIQLTYASRTSKTLVPDDLKSILAASQRNNTRVGVTGALCLSNGIFLQQLEGDRTAVSLLYHRILLDPRHRDPAILDFSEIASRKFTQWSMGSLSSLESNRAIYLKYSRTASFDPYTMSPTTLRSFFDEIMLNATWLG